MKHGFFLLLPLTLAIVSLVAPSQETAAAPKPMLPYVLVDPTEFRQPIPDPELGLTDKYDGKQVRFTGAVTKVSVDKKTKKHHYELQYVIVQQMRVKGKEVVVGKEAITVPVTLLNDDKSFQLQVEKLLGAKQPGPTVTVEGLGSIMVDGSLVITNAVLIAPDRKRPFEGR